MVEVGGLSETLDLYPPKAEATGSNPVGRANAFNYLAVVERLAAAALSAHCRRYPFESRSGPSPKSPSI